MNFKKANTIVDFLNRYGKNSIWKNSLFEEKSRTGKNSRIRGKNAIEICIKCGWFLERKNRKNGRHVHGGTFPAELAHNAAITRVQAGAKRRSKDVHVHQPRVLNPCVHTGARKWKTIQRTDHCRSRLHVQGSVETGVPRNIIVEKGPAIFDFTLANWY